ncbi:MAG: hypothetical protein ACM3RX_03090 [Methanococcaceae archaeon]
MKYLILLFLLGFSAVQAQTGRDTIKQAGTGAIKDSSSESLRLKVHKAYLNEFLLLLDPAFSAEPFTGDLNSISGPFSTSLNSTRKQSLELHEYENNREETISEIVSANCDYLLQALSQAAGARSESAEMQVIRQFLGFSKTTAAIVIILLHLIKYR